MPLPEPNLEWPPRQLANIMPALNAWSAWYSGDVATLESVYSKGAPGPVNRPSTYRGGVVGSVARFFWGQPRLDLTKVTRKLHVPVAADLCQMSADLLYSEPPTFITENAKVQDRLNELAGDGMFSTISEAAELTAALGSGYLRVTWDRDLEPSGPFLTSVDADGAWPEFRWGRLTAVTFWTVLAEDGQTVWRHLERHELRAGNGVVLHGLYEGRPDNLGRPVPLTENAGTARLADLVAEGNVIDTLTPGLAVAYIPNQRPQRTWRKDPLGRNLGRSDLDGVEGLMDALDETYTSWMRDIRLGKARVFIDQSMLVDDGPGKGASWDSDREVYAPLNTPMGSLNPNAARGAAVGIMVPQQFAIRVQEHADTAADLLGQILRTAGYSAQSFGESGDVAITATEVAAKERRSFLTRDRKIPMQRPPLQDIVEKLLAVDQAMFGGPGVERPRIEYADSVQDSQLQLAQTAQALRTAQAASTRTLVEMMHPDWDDKQVDAETAAIQQERNLADPLSTVPPEAVGPDGQPV